MEKWKNGLSVWTLIQNIQKDPTVLDNFVCRNDSLCYNNCLYICKKSQLEQKLILELQTSPIGGHSIFLERYHRVKKDFFVNVLKLIFKCSWWNV